MNNFSVDSDLSSDEPILHEESVVDGTSQSLPSVQSDFRLVQLEVAPEEAGQRIDIFLAMKCDGYSRVFIRKVLADGHVRLNDRPVKPSFKVQAGQKVEIDLPPPPSDGPIPENIPLDILYEDEFLVVINKSAGMVVHPAKGNWTGTLTSALAHHFQSLSDCGGPTRPGIVHRLDRDTTGVIAVAKTNEVHFKLAALFEARQVQKEYWAIVLGSMEFDRDLIRQPIGHHPYQRDKMAIRAGHESSRDAETYYEVVERFAGWSFLRVLPKTGRTHQIRVHLSHAGHAILCDRLYAGHAKITKGEILRRHVDRKPMMPGDDEIVMERHALHARRLEFQHPMTLKPLVIEAPIPHDFQSVIKLLQQQKSGV